MQAIVFSVSDDYRSGEILFPRGDEDPDHMTVWVDLPPGITTRHEDWAATHDILDAATPEVFAVLKARARPVDRSLI